MPLVDPAKPVRRFAVAYLSASAAATCAMLVVQTLLVFLAGWGWEGLHDFGGWALIYMIYSLGYTLVLGIFGWGLLRLLGWSNWIAYAAVGAVLGFVTAGAGLPNGFDYRNQFLYSFAAAGVAAGVSFRALYYR